MNQIERIRSVLQDALEYLEPLEMPDDETCKRIAAAFKLPLDYVKGTGIFREWEQIIRYYPDVIATLRDMILEELPARSHWGNTLYKWLLWTESDFLWQVEFRRVRFFAFAVADIHVEPDSDYYTNTGEDAASVEITFTPEFEAMIEAARDKETPTGWFNPAHFNAGFDSDE